MLGIDILKQHLGQQEVRDNKALKTWLKSQAINKDIAIDPAKISWCSAAINACEREVGHKGTGSLLAQSWLKWGTKVNPDDAQEGDVIIFHFPFNLAWQGHVGYFVEWDDEDNKVKCLGGNQQNMVCYAEYIQDYIIGIRRAI